jgi:hypothetical protein
VPIGSDDTHELWHSVGLLYLLRFTVGASSLLKMIGGGVDRSSSILVIRCLIRSFKRLVPGVEIRQRAISGRPDRLCLVGRKSSLMGNFDDR